MATNDQITRIKYLTKILNKYRDEYYNESRPSVDDVTYDSMMDELKDLEDKADFHCANSPNYTVGYVVNSELPKFKHIVKIAVYVLCKTRWLILRCSTH